MNCRCVLCLGCDCETCEESRRAGDTCLFGQSTFTRKDLMLEDRRAFSDKCLNDLSDAIALAYGVPIDRMARPEPAPTPPPVKSGSVVPDTLRALVEQK